MSDPSATTAAPGAGTSAPAPAPAQLPINLFTLHSPDSIPSSTYLLPSAWRRFQLSELINKVLTSGAGDEERAPVPFEFVVEGEVLRGSLEEWVRKNRGGDAERVVDVEYRRSLRAPEEVGRVQVKDWVSGLSLGRSGYILLSSYLSHIQLLPLASPSSNALTIPLPNLLGATCCAYLSPSTSNTNVRIAAGGVDRQVHVFSIPSLDPSSPSFSDAPREIYTLHGHTAPITSIVSARGGQDILSASWDGSINLYVLPPAGPDGADVEEEHQIPAEPGSYLPGQKKRRRLNAKGAEGLGDDGKVGVGATVEGLTDGEIGQAGWRRVPDNIMRGHKGRVGGLCWDKRDGEKVWSAGWDGSVRGWDLGGLGGAGIVKQGPADRAMLCVDQWNANGTLATGAMDRTVCLWDTREATSLVSLTLRTTSPVPSLNCHPTSPFTLAAATYAGQVQIWDVRSPAHALFSVQKGAAPAPGALTREVTENGKVLGERLLALDWDGERVVAGGEDGEVGIWNARGE